MVRTRACCEKMGIKKGPWTREEDEILVSHVQQFGHDNWRALPKQAGLLRCGKSCRLRWINYLRPDIKRGNFTLEEEETISKLHQIVGNRWSAIATKLPGRTDNEIKNLWHTRLKKKRDKESSPKQTCLQNFPSEISNNTKTAELSTQDISGNLISTSSYHYMVPTQTATHHVNISRNSETIHVNGAEESFQILYESNDMAFWYDLLKNAGNS